MYCCNKKHFIEIFQSVVTKIYQQKFITNDSETTMGNFKMVSEVIQKDSKGSVILPGLLAYNTESASDIYHLPFQQWPGHLEPCSCEAGHLCTDSILHVSSTFTDITKWTLLTQDNFWSIFLLLLGRRLALLIHQCSIETVLHGRSESLLHFK